MHKFYWKNTHCQGGTEGPDRTPRAQYQPSDVPLDNVFYQVRMDNRITTYETEITKYFCCRLAYVLHLQAQKMDWTDQGELLVGAERF